MKIRCDNKMAKSLTRLMGSVGIGLASLVSDGCATYEDTTALGVGLEILGGRAIDPNLGRAFNAAAGGAYSAANNQAMVEAAPRINQNVNIYNNQSSSSQNYNAKGEITNIRSELDSERYGVKGLKLYATFNLFNGNGKEIAVCAYAFDENGSPLKDRDKDYRSINGQVSMSTKVNPKFMASTYTDVELFIPMHQLDIYEPGRYKISWKVKLIDLTNGNDVIAETGNICNMIYNHTY